MKVSVILATLDEAENIGDLIMAVHDVVVNNLKKEVEVVIVDDNSPDGTAEIVERMNKPFVKLIVRKDERGLTSAIQRGINEASGDVLVWMDCDFSHPPAMIQTLVEALNDCDASVASRYVKGGGDARAKGLNPLLTVQTLLSLFLSVFTSLVLWCRFRDWSSGMIAIRKDLAKQFPLYGDYGEYFMFFVYRIIKRGFKVKEYPYIIVPRERGVSKTATNFLDFFFRGRKYLATVFQLRFRPSFAKK